MLNPKGQGHANFKTTFSHYPQLNSIIYIPRFNIDNKWTRLHINTKKEGNHTEN